MALDNAQLPIANNGNGIASIPEMGREDKWWVSPLITALGFGAFIIYATWRTFENRLFESHNYLSPFYSPLLPLGWQVFGFHVSPAILILPFPLFFRGTCYYYRKAYYRAFFWDPPACAVKEPAARKHYHGEREFPLVLQNLHRYAFYLAVIILVILWWDAGLAFCFRDEVDNIQVGMGLGSFIFLINVVLLTLYTFSCHSWRHLVGGCVDCFSCSAGSKVRHTIWERISHLNESHGLWAWCSLISVALTDLYVRCLSAGSFTDLRFF